jgi:hypothetical protein
VSRTLSKRELLIFVILEILFVLVLFRVVIGVAAPIRVDNWSGLKATHCWGVKTTDCQGWVSSSKLIMLESIQPTWAH